MLMFVIVLVVRASIAETNFTRDNNFTQFVASVFRYAGNYANSDGANTANIAFNTTAWNAGGASWPACGVALGVV